MEKLKAELPEMPWDTVKRLTEHYGVAGRDVETLLGLDEFDGEGVKYFEEVTGGQAKLGKRAINWYVSGEGPVLMIRIAHELLGQLGKFEIAWTPDLIPSKLMNEIITSLEDGTINGKLMHHDSVSS